MSECENIQIETDRISKRQNEMVTNAIFILQPCIASYKSFGSLALLVSAENSTWHCFQIYRASLLYRNKTHYLYKKIKTYILDYKKTWCSETHWIRVNVLNFYCIFLKIMRFRIRNACNCSIRSEAVATVYEVFLRSGSREGRSWSDLGSEGFIYGYLCRVSFFLFVLLARALCTTCFASRCTSGCVFF